MCRTTPRVRSASVLVMFSFAFSALCARKNLTSDMQFHNTLDAGVLRHGDSRVLCVTLTLTLTLISRPLCTFTTHHRRRCSAARRQSRAVRDKHRVSARVAHSRRCRRAAAVCSSRSLASVAVGGASALLTFIRVLCTLHTQISRGLCTFTHHSAYTHPLYNVRYAVNITCLALATKHSAHS
jgi:hypothetical protein